MPSKRATLASLLVLSASASISDSLGLQKKFESLSEKIDADVPILNDQSGYFKTEGRWEDRSKNDNLHWISDLPCSGVSFNVETDSYYPEHTITIKHHSVRTRILVTVVENMTGTVVSQDIIVGEPTDVLPDLKP